MVQLPSLELNGEVAPPACLTPLISISEMFSCNSQTVAVADDGHALMEQVDDEKFGNKGPLQRDRQQMLQLAEEIQGDKEGKN